MTPTKRILSALILLFSISACGGPPPPAPAVIVPKPQLAVADLAPLVLDPFQFHVTVDNTGAVTYWMDQTSSDALQGDLKQLQDRLQWQQKTLQDYRSYYEGPDSKKP